MPHRSWRAWFAVALFACACPAFGQTFVFHLRGDQEVPPVASVASGGCMGQLDQPGATFAITCVHDVVGATVMHIHQGAAGVNGPILFDMGDPASPVTATWTGMTPAEIADLLAGNLYINIHTGGRPSGEIRGQILTRTVDLVPFTMDGNQVVPSNGTTATGTCTADLSNDATQLDVQCTHNLPGALEAHVHDAPVLQNGPIVFSFPSPASPLSGLVPLTPQLVASFAATFLYVDVHTVSGEEDTASPEIRGQIGAPPAGAGTGTIRVVKDTEPAGGTGFTFTENVTLAGAFALNDGGTQTFSGVAAGTYTITEDDPSGLGYTLGALSCDDSDSTENPFNRTATVELQAGETVTCTFRNLLTAPSDSIFVFDMSGAQEVPPVATPHRGGCMGRFDAGSSRLVLICTHDVESATVTHIHRGAAGVNGPIVFDLGPPDSPVIATWDGMTPADVADLFAGNLYANIHTAGRPAGEIRGQILTRTVDMVSFTADASQVVPPGVSPATGSCTADLDNPATSLAVQCTHNLASPDLAHVHQAPAGQNGPEVFTFPSAASPISGNVPMTPRLVADFAATFLYVDIHATSGGEGTGDEIRGQIGAPVAPPTTGTIRIVKSTSPAGGSGFNFTDDVPGSGGAFTLNDGGEQMFSSVPVGTYTITEAVTAGYSLTDVSCTDTDSTGNPFARTATVQLQAGELVTCTFRNFQTSSGGTLFVFHLSGDQEVPPVATAARGGCMGRLDPIAASFAVVCTHDVGVPAVAHIHQGAAGVNGPILFDLGDPERPIEATWTGMTPGEIADLQAGNLYINIHSGGRPSGEIRGQILPRTVDNFSFPIEASQEVPPTSSPATGSCTADLADDAANLLVQCTHNVTNVVDIHLHSAPPGFDGPIVFNFPTTNPFSGNVPMTPRLVADFAAGFLYVNIHSTDFPQGEIRGQLIAAAPATNVGDIPTLSEWAFIFLALSLVAVAWWRIR